MEAAELGSMIWSSTIQHLWEATVFGGLIGLLLLAWRGSPARVRHGLLLLASLKFLVPSFLLAAAAVRLDLAEGLVHGFHSILPEPLSAWLPAAAAGPEGLGDVLPAALLPALAGLWMLGFAACVFRWRDQHRSLRRLLAESRPVEGRAARRLEHLLDRLSLRRRVRLRTSEAVREPAVCGVLSPCILLPEGVGEHLSQDELDAVLLHELIHVRRWDNLTAMGLRVVCCLFWFHPLSWWLERQLLVERERIVDEQVVALGGGPRVYVRGLLKVIRFGLELQPAGVSSAGAGRLAERIEWILQPVASRGASARGLQRVLCASGVAALVLFSLLPLPRALCPTLLAEQDPSRFLHAPADVEPSVPPILRQHLKPDCTG